MFTYSGAKWCPKHDVTLIFPINQTVFLCFYVENSKIENFSYVISITLGYKKQYKKFFEIFILCPKHDVAFRFS